MALSSRLAKALVAVGLVVVFTISLFMLHPPMRVYIDPWTGSEYGEGGVDSAVLRQHDNVKTGAGLPSLDVIKGSVIMPELGNATAKALLGQATWKLMHTMTLRFPEHPTQDERDALSSYFYLTSRLYPCGECAKEFQGLLKSYPPQTSSRKVASLWLCHVHNLVNQRLLKKEFDCTKLDETYDCGCGDPPSNPASSIKASSQTGEPMTEDEVTGQDMIKGGIGG